MFTKILGNELGLVAKCRKGAYPSEKLISSVKQPKVKNNLPISTLPLLTCKIAYRAMIPLIAAPDLQVQISRLPRRQSTSVLTHFPLTPFDTGRIRSRVSAAHFKLTPTRVPELIGRKCTGNVTHDPEDPACALRTIQDALADDHFEKNISALRVAWDLILPKYQLFPHVKSLTEKYRSAENVRWEKSFTPVNA